MSFHMLIGHLWIFGEMSKSFASFTLCCLFFCQRQIFRQVWEQKKPLCLHVDLTESTYFSGEGRMYKTCSHRGLKALCLFILPWCVCVCDRVSHDLCLEQYFSNFISYPHHLGMLLKCRFWFSRALNKLPVDANAVGSLLTVWLARP